MIRSLQKKGTKLAVEQRNENAKGVHGQEHSWGILSVVVSLLHDAQEIAILTGREVLDLEALRHAYQQRMGLMHDYIRPAQGRQTSQKEGFPFFSLDRA